MLDIYKRSCYFVFDKLNSLNVIATVYIILDHPSYMHASIMMQAEKRYAT